MAITIRAASATDIRGMADLIAVKRTLLESLEPVMWRPSDQAGQITPSFFSHQLGQPNVVARVAMDGERMLGFIMGAIADAPPVFSPGGKTIIVDDFAVIDGPEADEAASGLLEAVMSEGRARGAVQIIIVAAARDARAVRWLDGKKLHVASQWWTKTLSH